MSEGDNKYKYYLRDLGYLVKEYALEAKAKREQHKGQADQDFYSGELLAYYGIVSLMQQQAMGFGIDLSELNLHDINPDKDLI